MAMPILRIAHLYPALMNLYGDRGNIIALQRRAAQRGIGSEVTPLRPGDSLTRRRFHVFFFGGGQDAEQTLIYRDFIDLKGTPLKEEIEDGAACLAVCGGYQLLGRWYEVFGGKRIEGSGALDLHTEAGKVRSIGNVLIEADLHGQRFQMVGFENHGGRTILGPGLAPLGRVLVGGGNNGKDGTEGALYKNTVGTYLHGPVLPKNPRLTDFLIERGLQRLEPGFRLEAATTDMEDQAFQAARAITVAERGKRWDRFRRT